MESVQVQLKDESGRAVEGEKINPAIDDPLKRKAAEEVLPFDDTHPIRQDAGFNSDVDKLFTAAEALLR